MVGTRAALRYARALMNLARDKKLSEEINEDMKLILKTLEESNDLEAVLQSPVIKSDQKREILDKIFSGKVNEMTLGMLSLLIENKRLAILPLVAKEYIVIFDFVQGIEVAQITTAVPLTKDLEKEMLKRINESIDKEITLNNIVDPSIIGGFILRVGDKEYDSSVTYRLKDLLSQFEDNQYISKLK